MRQIKEALSLKQFMVRSEVLKLYRDYMKVGRLIEELNNHTETSKRLRQEWVDWVRAEFRIRKNVTDENTIKMLLSTGGRQLKELERSVRLGSN